jgi:hypothetical protein
MESGFVFNMEIDIMSTKYFLGILISGFCLIATSTIAAPNYNYLEVSFSTGELELGVDGIGSADIDQDGFKLDGSVAAGESVLLRASYAALSGDESGVDIDVDTTIIGAGWILPVSDSTGVDLGLVYRKDDLDLSGFGSGDVDGAGLSAGIRSNVSDNLELAARLSYLGSDYDGAYSIDLSGTYHFSDTFGASLGLEYLDVSDEGVDVELSQILLGLRWSF